MEDDTAQKLGELEAALNRLVNAHIRAITPKDRFADMYESLETSAEACAAIGAFLLFKAASRRAR